MDVFTIEEFEQLFNNDAEYVYKGELSMWRGVIIQALRDAKLPKTNKRYRIWRLQALEWLNLENEDFILVCLLAKLPCDVVLSALRSIESQHDFYIKD